MTLHYASGNNIDAQGNFVPAQAGFNLADVSSVEELNALPAGVMGLVWLDQYSGVNQSFVEAVTPFIGNPKVYGFFLVDEPDPTGQWGTQASAADLKAESDWIHANVPGAKTFITLMNMGSSDDPSYANTYTPENTHIDLFGIDPYPVRSGNSTTDYNMIDDSVAAAVASGIPLDQIVPVYQTFGGGNWVNDEGGSYVMPTVAQAQEIFDHWDALVPNPAFDYAYAWGSQEGDVALESSQALQDLFLQHNTSESTTPVPETDESTTPVVDTSPDTDEGTTPVVDTSPDTDGGTTPVVDTSPDTDGGTTPVVDTSPDTGGGTTPVVDTSPDTGGSTAPVIAPTPPSEPTTSPVIHAHGFGHKFNGLDFSQLLDGGTFNGGGNHYQLLDGGKFHGGGNHNRDFTAAAALSIETDTTSTAVTDSTPLSKFDLISHHVHNTDHHSWHW